MEKLIKKYVGPDDEARLRAERRMDVLHGGPTLMPTPNSPYVDVNTFGPSLLGMLAMRMRWNTSSLIGSTGFVDVYCTKTSKAVLTMVVLDNGDYIVIEDDPSLFPSDKLVTKLRTIQS